MNFFGKPYLLFGDYLRDKYLTPVSKLPINAGLSCPNRDGTLGKKGCIFCSEDGSSSHSSTHSNNIISQMENAKKSFSRSPDNLKYIAYFQSYTNTYSDIKILKYLYDKATGVKDVMGLMIGTRPDNLSDKILDLIASYKKNNFELWLEIGLQSIHDKSLKFLNRQHDYQVSYNSIMRASERGIPVCIHIIIGIPGESWDDMMETADTISRLPICGVKIHHLHVIKDTPLEKLYYKNKINLLSIDEYTAIIVDFIERLRPDITIHRLMGERNKETLIAPKWGLRKGTVQQLVNQKFRERATNQGFLFNSN
jgi:uncharacterized protein